MKILFNFKLYDGIVFSLLKIKENTFLSSIFLDYKQEKYYEDNCLLRILKSGIDNKKVVKYFSNTKAEYMNRKLFHECALISCKKRNFDLVRYFCEKAGMDREREWIQYEVFSINNHLLILYESMNNTPEISWSSTYKRFVAYQAAITKGSYNSVDRLYTEEFKGNIQYIPLYLPAYRKDYPLISYLAAKYNNNPTRYYVYDGNLTATKYCHRTYPHTISGIFVQEMEAVDSDSQKMVEYLLCSKYSRIKFWISMRNIEEIRKIANDREMVRYILGDAVDKGDREIVGMIMKEYADAVLNDLDYRTHVAEFRGYDKLAKFMRKGMGNGTKCRIL